MDDQAARAAVDRLEGLLAQIEHDEAALAAVQALLELYGEGLARIVEQAPAATVGELAGDELIGHLLVLHDLHPLSLAERVEGALDEVRPYLATHGGGVELLGVEEGVVRLQLEGSCSGCPSSRVTLESAVHEAIERVAPDASGIEAIDGEPAAPPPGIPLPMACPAPVAAAAGGRVA
ncbi:MAG TPA: NifU family protein [Conexibacter sp.]|jgi:Fe-S cluster biogenesis protein NfuA|nr:NifU family protein [Conexibacter sp.]